MGLLDIIRKRKPEPMKPPRDMAALASTAEFITSCLLMADLPLPQSQQEEARKKANELAVSIFRNIYDQQQMGPSPEMSDALILDIYRQVGCAFREVGKERGEFVESAVINVIVLKFFEVYRQSKELARNPEMPDRYDFFKDHLEYEIEKYRREGLRADYSRQPLHLFRAPG
jgi:hypothetical protein